MKTLKDLLKDTPVTALHGDGSTTVAALAYDSRAVTRSDCFFATRGTQSDGHDFIPDAVAKGASAVVCEQLPAETAHGVAYVVVPDAAGALADMAAAFYGHPSRELKLVGITGTNCKTTTATLLYDLVRALGYKAGLVSTVVYKVGERIVEATHTTPDPVRLNAMMREMADEGCEYCFMECSSHAIVQQRTRGLHFAGGIFSNITHDHLDYHKTFAEYIRAKKLFFDSLAKDAFALTNADDKNGRDFKNDDRETNRLLWEEYRIFSNPEMNDKAKAINDDTDGTFGAKLKMEAKQLAPYEEYLANHGMTWPVRNVNGTWKSTKWRFAEGSQDEGFDEVGVKQYGKPGQAGGVSFYKSANLKPSVVFRPYEPPAQTPSDEYPFYFVTGRLLEHWHTGTMTRRVPELDRALPEALLNMNPDDCKKLGIQDGDMVKVKSTYGEFDIKVSTAGRTEPPAGVTFAPFFAEETLVNLAVQDVYCPLSKEPDYKKTCVSITKL